VVAAGARAEEPLHATSEQFFPLPLDGAVNVENLDGSIHIFGWYESRVRVAVVRNAYTAARLQQLRNEINASAGAVAIHSVVPPARGIFADRSGTLDYTVNVPETAQLTLRLRSGEISLQGLRGAYARIDIGNGRVFVRNCFARVEAHAVQGAIDVFYEWWENIPALLDLRLEHGRIGAVLPVIAKIKIDATTADGQVSNGFGLKAQDARKNGQTLRGANASDASASLQLRTGGGNISIDSWH
jgi:hypothetical protein